MSNTAGKGAVRAKVRTANFKKTAVTPASKHAAQQPAAHFTAKYPVRPRRFEASDRLSGHRLARVSSRHEIGLDKGVQVSVQNAIDIADFAFRSMVLRKPVGV